MRTSAPSATWRGIAVTALVCLATLTSTPARASHQPRFEQSEVQADSDAELTLQVPEAGREHNPNGMENHSTTQVNVTIPDGFDVMACRPPDGWDCVRSGDVLRYDRKQGPVVATGRGVYDLGVFVRTPPANGSHAFRTVQVYNDGHESRFTAGGGTAPTIDVVGGEASSQEGPDSTPPSPASEPSTAPSAAPSREDEQRQDSPKEDDAQEASTTMAAPAPSPSPSPAATAARTEPSPQPVSSPTPADPTPTPGDTSAASPAPADDTTLADEEQPLAAEPMGADADTGNLTRAALSLLLVGAGWTLVEYRARRSTTR